MMYFYEQDLMLVAIVVFILLCLINAIKIKELIAIDKERRFIECERDRLEYEKFKLEQEIIRLKGE